MIQILAVKDIHVPAKAPFSIWTDMLLEILASVLVYSCPPSGCSAKDTIQQVPGSTLTNTCRDL